MTGEELYTKTEFREVFERRAADILNPDVCNCGGILELKEIAAMAEPHHVAWSRRTTTTAPPSAWRPPSTPRPAMPNFLITEYFVNFEDLGRAIARTPLRVEESYITLPTAPGLGVDLNEDEIARHPYRVRSLRPLRRPRDE